ncbi:MAG: aspartate--tRNA ligase [Chloroflexi bacterium]|nr:aspartate--tRNA ligase [Chloroflexota bacterium]
MHKTIACGDLRPEHVGTTVTLAGWVNRRRDHGGIIFIDLRDGKGIGQVVFNPDLSPTSHTVAEQFRNEWVVQVSGEVRPRPPGTENPALATGQVEVHATEALVLNPAQTPPFSIGEGVEVDEMVRMRYRYLDLRRQPMQENLRLRHRVIKFMRDFLDARDFVEIETPILIKSTPEGARDYLVPSRVHPGHFYALPQSPQQLKQLLMVSGFEKYDQIARCFRDEDLRADRQPEFTQLDLEMAFVHQEDVLELIEELYIALVETLTPQKRLLKPFPRVRYDDAVSKYGTDKPDLRFGLPLADLTEVAHSSQFRVLRDPVAQGGVVKGFAVPGIAGYSRRQTDELAHFARERGASGLLTVPLGGTAASLDDLKLEDIPSSLARYVSLEEVRAMARATGAGVGDMMLIAAGPASTVNVALGQLRQEMGRRLGLADPNHLAFAFIVDFPLLEWNETEGRWDSSHHPFTSPMEQYWEHLEADPGKARAQCYDLVCNGVELASGSIRIHRRDRQARILRLLGYSDAEIQERFGHLLEAFDFGAPPHGGIAPGIDRLVVLLSEGAESIRDVIAFPKTQSAVDLLFGAPSPVREEQLRELHLKVVPDEEKG